MSRIMMTMLIGIAFASLCASCMSGKTDRDEPPLAASERQITHQPLGHILTNTAVWSPDGNWIVYDVRSDPAGTVFDGQRIEKVNVNSGQVKVLYTSKNGACCGVATCSPTEEKYVFILGPENPTPDWSYSASHRQGVIVHADSPGIATNLDARDLTQPFTAGALRGGTHVHVFSGDGQWVSFTYNDAVLEQFQQPSPDHDVDQRNVGVSVPARAVYVAGNNPRNHAGEYFSVLVTRTTSTPKPGSDEIQKAYENAWVGRNGYVKSDGSHQSRAIAFQGDVVTSDGKTITEAFIVDLPDDLTRPGDGPLEGTATRRPIPPRGVAQRRLTFTERRKFPGIQGPRHWLLSSPDGSRIAMLMKDDAGIVQIYTISPNGGEMTPVTRNPFPVASAFSWSPDGLSIAYIADNSVFVTDVQAGSSVRMTHRTDDANAPRPEACVFSPDGGKIAFLRNVSEGGSRVNQIFVATLR